MADISNLFKAQVKALKHRNKSLGDSKIDDSPTNILPKKKGSEFESKAKNLVKTISKLRDFLLDNRKSYVNSGSLLSSNGSSMSDSERDQIDNDAQQIIKTCRDTIIAFRVETGKQKVHPQVKEHRHSAMILVEAYLKVICKMYSEQRAVRVKRVVDKKRISKLEPEKRYNQFSRQNLKKNLNIDSAEKENMAPSEKKELSEKSKQQPPPLFDELSTFANPEEEISSEEAQMFAQENAALYEEMNSMSEEVKQVEGQVVEIAKLQEIFTEKILEQDVQMSEIASTVIGTTENIIDGNEEIRKAMRKKSEFRVMILFFLLVCTLSLLFLDWYNN